MTFNTNTKKQFELPLVAQLMSQVPGEEWKKPQISVVQRTNTKP